MSGQDAAGPFLSEEPSGICSTEVWALGQSGALCHIGSQKLEYLSLFGAIESPANEKAIVEGLAARGETWL